MKFDLKNTNIFNKNIAFEVDQLIGKNIELFNTNKGYTLTINYNSIFNDIENIRGKRYS